MITSKKLIAQAILRKDPLAFFERSLPTIMPGVPYLSNWHLQAMSAAIEEMISGDAQRYIINIHPRMSKSLFVSVSLPMFLLMQNPALKIMCLSYAEQLASQFHQSSRLISKAKWYRELNPNLAFKSTADGANTLKETGDILQTSSLGYRLARSFHGSITGLGADWIIMDDPNDISQINSEAHRNKIKETFDSTIATRLNSKEGRILLVTQRGHTDDLSGHLLEKGGFKHLKIEAEATERTIYNLGNGQRYIREKSDLIDPRRFGTVEIAERRRDLGSAAYEAQYQQNPQPPEGNVFKRKWLELVENIPEFQYVIISGDIAGSLNRGDYTAFLVWGYFDGTWYLIAAHRAQLDLPGVVRLYRQLDEQYEPDLTAIEQNGVGAGFVQRMKEIGYKHVQGISVTGDKTARAESITPLLERKQVAFHKTMTLYDPFMHELLSFPSSKHDDMVDAFTLAMTYRKRILQVANRYRRPKRANLPVAPSTKLEVRITPLGGSTSYIRDNYFERNGVGAFFDWI